MTVEDPLVLAGEFPQAGPEQWMALVRRVLFRDGDPTPAEFAAAFERRLVTRALDGFDIGPLYTDLAGLPPSGVPGRPPFTRGTAATGGWDIRPRVVVAGDGSDAGGLAAAALASGATSLLLDLRGAGAFDAGAFDRATSGVDLNLLVLDAGPRALAAAEAFFALLERRGLSAGAVTAGLGADPVGDHARGEGDVARALAGAAALAGRCAREAPGIRAIVVDGTPYHDAGGSDADEVGCVLATGVVYLRTLTDAGISIDDACRQLEFRLAATADQFLTIAKFRAARRLWSEVAGHCGASPEAQAARLHAVTSRAMTARYDPWVNLLRATVACFGAAVGGAQAITVAPHDDLLTPGGSDLGRRLARNVGAVLADEAHLGRVADPAGGSFYVERLTADLAAAAWDCLGAIERTGGMVAALDAKVVADRLDRTWQERLARLATRRAPITGVSEFPNLDEPAPPPLPGGPAADGDGDRRGEPSATVGGRTGPTVGGGTSPTAEREASPTAVAGARAAGIVDGPSGHGLPRRRYAEPFEEQRERADRQAARGERPTVFLAALGPAAASNSRVSFARAWFEAGGIRAVVPPAGAGSPEEAAATFGASRARLACLCSSDAVYGEMAAAAAGALKAAGAERVYLACQAAPVAGHCSFPSIAAAGVDEFIHAGGDVLDSLRRALDALGLA